MRLILFCSIKKGEWTEEEDRKLLEAYEELGQRWSKIAARLPGRTENAVKIRWKGLQRKQRRSSGGRRSSIGSVSSGFTDDSNQGAQQHTDQHLSAASPLQTIASHGNVLPDPHAGEYWNNYFYETAAPEPYRVKNESSGSFDRMSFGLENHPSWYSSGHLQQQQPATWGTGRHLAQPHGSGQSLRSLFSFSSVSSSTSRMSNNSSNQQMLAPGGSWAGDNAGEIQAGGDARSTRRREQSADLDFHDVVDVSLKTDYIDDHE